MRLNDSILCVPLYYNVPGLLHRNAGSGQFRVREGILTARAHPDRR